MEVEFWLYNFHASEGTDFHHLTSFHAGLLPIPLLDKSDFYLIILDYLYFLLNTM